MSSNSSRAEKVSAGMADTKDLLSCTRIENAHKARKTICVFYYVAVICTTTEGTKQIRACVSRYGQSA